MSPETRWPRRCDTRGAAPAAVLDRLPDGRAARGRPRTSCRRRILRFHREGGRRRAEGVPDHGRDAARDRPPALGARAARGLRRRRGCPSRSCAAPGPTSSVERRRDALARVPRAAGAAHAGRARRLRAARAVRLRARRDRRDRRQERAELPPDPARARAATSTRGGRASSRRASAARRCWRASSPRCGWATSTGSSGCSPPTPSTTPTAAARRARRCCRSTARDKVARLWAALGTRRGASTSCGPSTSTASPASPAFDAGRRRCVVVLTLDVADDRDPARLGGGQPGQARRRGVGAGAGPGGPTPRAA